jgi:ELWxxDGT repeat protein
VLVKDIRPGALGSDAKYLSNLNGLVVFSANDGTSGVELWRSNGQAVGTVRVKDLRPGAAGSDPQQLVNHNSMLFFAANNGTSGVELFRSTGFGPGTVLAADINPAAASSNPAFITAAGTNLFFAANNGSSGNELWSLTNPTAAGVSLGEPASFVAVAAPGDTASFDLIWEAYLVENGVAIDDRDGEPAMHESSGRPGVRIVGVPHAAIRERRGWLRTAKSARERLRFDDSLPSQLERKRRADSPLSKFVDRRRQWAVGSMAHTTVSVDVSP